MIKTLNPRVRSRKLWDKHGSVLILIVVAILAFNGGAEWRDYKTRDLITMIVDSGVAEREQLRGRLRQVNDMNRELSRQLGPAVDKANIAVDKANKALDKADDLLEKKK